MMILSQNEWSKITSFVDKTLKRGKFDWIWSFSLTFFKQHYILKERKKLQRGGMTRPKPSEKYKSWKRIPKYIGITPTKETSEATD